MTTAALEKNQPISETVSALPRHHTTAAIGRSHAARPTTRTTTLRRHVGSGAFAASLTATAVCSSSLRPTPTSNSEGRTIPPTMPIPAATAITIGKGTSMTKIARNATIATATISALASVAPAEADERVRDDADDGRREPGERPRDPPEIPVRHVHPRKAQEQEEARQDERDARDDATPDAVEQPADVRGELHRLRTRQQHAVAERVEVPALVDPPPALDELLMHQGDLPRGSAEVHESEPDPEAGRLAERGGPSAP